VFSYVAPPRPPCPILLAVHDPTFLTNPEWLGRRARWVLGSLGVRSARRAQAVLTLSRTAKTDVCAALGLDPARVHVVTPYADPVFTERRGAAERVLARWALDRYVLTVGDIGPRKNLEALGEAVAMLDEPGLELVVVGRSGVEGDAILASTRARWLGPVSDEELADLYSAAAVTAHPARYEGFGLTVLEAMSCASPVVVADSGALPEVVGDAGIVVAPDAAALAEGIRAALEPATADRLREMGPARAARYSRQAMGDAAWSAIGTVTR
jgi:glycosyltransferase involved in cell wall biosynthesis